MKATDSIRNKIKKVPVSTCLFWIACFVAALTAILQLIIPGAPSVLYILTVGGIVLASWQKVIGDHEQVQKFEQEHKERVAAEQRVWNDTPAGRQHAALSQLLTEMHMDSQKLRR